MHRALAQRIQIKRALARKAIIEKRKEDAEQQQEERRRAERCAPPWLPLDPETLIPEKAWKKRWSSARPGGARPLVNPDTGNPTLKGEEDRALAQRIHEQQEEQRRRPSSARPWLP